MNNSFIPKTGGIKQFAQIRDIFINVFYPILFLKSKLNLRNL